MKKRILASVLSLVYLVSNVVLTHATEINVWKERRQAQQYAALPSVLPPLSPLPVLPSSAENILVPKIKKAAPQSLQPLIDAVSLSFATVQDVYDSGSKQNAPVLLIQDVHLNHEAQLNTANLLQHLIDTNHIGRVGVEGAFGLFDFTAFRKYSTKPQAKNVLDDLLSQNLVGAPSYVGITSSKELPIFLGVDDPQHYAANVDALSAARTKAPSAIQALTQEKILLQQRKVATLSPELLAFDQARTAYHDGQLNMGAYAERLSRHHVEATFVVDQFLEAYRMETRINFDQVERERRAVMEKLANALSEQELANLTEQSVAYRAGRLGFGAYYAGVRQLCQNKGVLLQRASHFENYLRYVLLCDGIKADALFEGIEKLERNVAASLVRTSKQKDLLDASEHLSLAEKLVHFSLTAKEWGRYLSLRAQRSNLFVLTNNVKRQIASVDSLLRNDNLEEFENFYREADIRSEMMAKNLFESQITNDKAQNLYPSILVIGGFHTPLVSQLLRQKKISYVVVSPKLTLLRQGSGGQAEYLGIFAREKTPLDRLFAGEKLFLSPDHLAVGTAAKSSALTGLLLSAALSVLPGNLPSQTTVANIVHEQSSYAVRYAPSLSVAEHLKAGTLRWGPVTITHEKRITFWMWWDNLKPILLIGIAIHLFRFLKKYFSQSKNTQTIKEEVSASSEEEIRDTRSLMKQIRILAEKLENPQESSLYQVTTDIGDLVQKIFNDHLDLNNYPFVHRLLITLGKNLGQGDDERDNSSITSQTFHRLLDKVGSRSLPFEARSLVIDLIGLFLKNLDHEQPNVEYFNRNALFSVLKRLPRDYFTRDNKPFLLEKINLLARPHVDKSLLYFFLNSIPFALFNTNDKPQLLEAIAALVKQTEQENPVAKKETAKNIFHLLCSTAEDVFGPAEGSLLLAAFTVLVRNVGDDHLVKETMNALLLLIKRSRNVFPEGDGGSANVLRAFEKALYDAARPNSLTVPLGHGQPDKEVEISEAKIKKILGIAGKNKAVFQALIGMWNRYEILRQQSPVGNPEAEAFFWNALALLMLEIEKPHTSSQSGMVYLPMLSGFVAFKELPFFLPVIFASFVSPWFAISIHLVASFLFAKTHQVGRDAKWLSTSQRIFIGVVGFGFGALLLIPGAPIFTTIVAHFTYNSFVNLVNPLVPWLPHATAKAPNLDDIYSRALDVLEGDVNLKNPGNKTWIMQDVTYLLGQLRRGKKTERARVVYILDRYLMGLEGSNFFTVADVGFLDRASDLVIKKQMWSLHQRLIKVFGVGDSDLYKLPYSKKLIWRVLEIVKTGSSRTKAEAVETFEEYIARLPIGYFTGDDIEYFHGILSVVAGNKNLMEFCIGPLFRSISGSGQTIMDSSVTDISRKILTFLITPVGTTAEDSRRKEELITFLQSLSAELSVSILTESLIARIIADAMGEGPWQEEDLDVLSDNLFLLDALLKKLPDSFFDTLPRKKAQVLIRHLRRHLAFWEHNMSQRSAELLKLFFEKLPTPTLRAVHKQTIKAVLRDLFVYGNTVPGEEIIFDAARMMLEKYPQFRTASNMWRGLQVAWHPDAPHHATNMFKFLWIFCDEPVEESTRFAARTLNKIFMSLDHPKTITISVGGKPTTIVLTKEAMAQLFIWRGKSLADQLAITAFLAAMWRGYNDTLRRSQNPQTADTFFWQALAIYASHFPEFSSDEERPASESGFVVTPFFLIVVLSTVLVFAMPMVGAASGIAAVGVLYRGKKRRAAQRNVVSLLKRKFISFQSVPEIVKKYPARVGAMLRHLAGSLYHPLDRVRIKTLDLLQDWYVDDYQPGRFRNRHRHIFRGIVDNLNHANVVVRKKTRSILLNFFDAIDYPVLTEADAPLVAQALLSLARFKEEDDNANQDLFRLMERLVEECVPIPGPVLNLFETLFLEATSAPTMRPLIFDRFIVHGVGKKISGSFFEKTEDVERAGALLQKILAGATEQGLPVLPLAVFVELKNHMPPNEFVRFVDHKNADFVISMLFLDMEEQIDLWLESGDEEEPKLGNLVLIMAELLRRFPEHATFTRFHDVVAQLWNIEVPYVDSNVWVLVRVFSEYALTEEERAMASAIQLAMEFPDGFVHSFLEKEQPQSLTLDPNAIAAFVGKIASRDQEFAMLRIVLSGAWRQYLETIMGGPQKDTEALNAFLNVWAYLIRESNHSSRSSESGFAFTSMLLIIVFAVLLVSAMPMVGMTTGVAAYGILHVGKKRKEMEKKTAEFFSSLRGNRTNYEGVLRQNPRLGKRIFDHLTGSLYHPSESERKRSMKRLLRWYSERGLFSNRFFRNQHRRAFAALVDNLGDTNPDVVMLANHALYEFFKSASHVLKSEDGPLLFKGLTFLATTKDRDENQRRNTESLIANFIHLVIQVNSNPTVTLDFMEYLFGVSIDRASQKDFRGALLFQELLARMEEGFFAGNQRAQELLKKASAEMAKDKRNISAQMIVYGFRKLMTPEEYVDSLGNDTDVAGDVIQNIIGDFTFRLEGRGLRSASVAKAAALLTQALLKFPEHITKRNFQIVVAEMWADKSFTHVEKEELALIDVFVKYLPADQDRAMAAAIRVGLAFPADHVHTMMNNGKPVVMLLGNGEIARFVGQQFDLNKQSPLLETTLAGMGRQYMDLSPKNMTLAVVTLMNAWALVINAFTKPSQDDGPMFESEPVASRPLASAPAPKSTRGNVTNGIKDLRDLTAGLKANELNPVSPKNRERIKRAIHFGVTHLLHPRAQTRSTISEEFLGLMAELESSRLTIRERKFSSQVLNSFLAVLQRPRLGVVFDTLSTLAWFFRILPWNITRVVSKAFLVGKLLPQLNHVFERGDVDDRLRVMGALNSLIRRLPKSFFTPREKTLCDELVRVLLAGLESDQVELQRNAIEAIQKLFEKISDAGFSNINKDQFEKILMVLAKIELVADADLQRESFAARADLIARIPAVWLKNNMSLEEIKSLVEGLMSRFEDRHETIQITCRYNLTSFLEKIPAPLFGLENTDALSKAISAAIPHHSGYHAGAVVALLKHTPVEVVLAEREKLLDPALHAVLPATFHLWDKAKTNNLDFFKDMLAISPNLRTQTVFQYFLAHVWTREFPLLIEQSIPVLELFLQSPEERVQAGASALIRVLKHEEMSPVVVFPEADEANQTPTFFGVTRVMMSVGTVAAQENSSVPLMQLLSGLERQYQESGKDNPNLAEKTFWMGLGLFVRQVSKVKNPGAPESGMAFLPMVGSMGFLSIVLIFVSAAVRELPYFLPVMLTPWAMAADLCALMVILAPSSSVALAFVLPLAFRKKEGPRASVERLLDVIDTTPLNLEIGRTTSAKQKNPQILIQLVDDARPAASLALAKAEIQKISATGTPVAVRFLSHDPKLRQQLADLARSAPATISVEVFDRERAATLSQAALNGVVSQDELKQDIFHFAAPSGMSRDLNQFLDLPMDLSSNRFRIYLLIIEAGGQLFLQIGREQLQRPGELLQIFHKVLQNA